VALPAPLGLGLPRGGDREPPRYGSLTRRRWPGGGVVSTTLAGIQAGLRWRRLSDTHALELLGDAWVAESWSNRCCIVSSASAADWWVSSLPSRSAANDEASSTCSSTAAVAAATAAAASSSEAEIISVAAALAEAGSPPPAMPPGGVAWDRIALDSCGLLDRATARFCCLRMISWRTSVAWCAQATVRATLPAGSGPAAAAGSGSGSGSMHVTTTPPHGAPRPADLLLSRREGGRKRELERPGVSKKWF